VTAKELIKRLKSDGWVEIRQIGSHKQFKHPSKPGLVTVPFHTGDIAIGTLRSIIKHAGLQ